MTSKYVDNQDPEQIIADLMKQFGINVNPKKTYGASNMIEEKAPKTETLQPKGLIETPQSTEEIVNEPNFLRTDTSEKKASRKIKPIKIGKKTQPEILGTILSSQEDIALVAFNRLKNKILSNIAENIACYKNNTWNKSNIGIKAFSNRKEGILSVKAPKEIFAFNVSGTNHSTDAEKISLLNNIGQQVVQGVYDKEIKAFLISKQKRMMLEKNKLKDFKANLKFEIATSKLEEKRKLGKMAKQPNWNEKYKFKN